MKKETEKNPQISAQEMRRVLSTTEGQQLLSMLTKSGGFNKAMEAFKKGDMQGVQEALRPVVETEQANELMQKINKK